MKNIVKRIYVFCLAIAMCFGLTAVVNTVSSEYVAVEAVDYYAGITAKSGNALLGQVHDLITTTHREYTSYDDCATPSMVERTDKGSKSKTIMDFYTQSDMSSSWGGGSVGSWNREHVWCKSHSNGLWGTSGGGSDMHHIRPSESSLNSTRGNNKFGNVNGGNGAFLKDKNGNKILGGYVGSGNFEPLDNVKGDVARIVFYVYTHYNTYKNVYGSTNGSGSSNYFGTLKFTDIVAGSESNAIEMLIDWSANDPVDQIERTRNEAVYSIQGNRNPFIDHPEYAKAIWAGGSTDDPVIDPPTTKLESINLNKTSISMYKGDTSKLTATPNPTNASLNANWTSSNTSVATVSTDGTVTAVSKGTATITVSSKDNSAIKATVTVTVYEKGSENEPDELKVKEFKNAVKALQSASTVNEQFMAISKAITSFNGLSDVDKKDATNEVEELKLAIENYNKMIDSYNKDAENNEQIVLNDSGTAN